MPDIENGYQNNCHVNFMTSMHDPRSVHFDGCLLLMQADGFSALVQSSVLGKGVKHRPPPIKLPAGSACASSGETNLMYVVVYVMYVHYIILYVHACMYVCMYTYMSI